MNLWEELNSSNWKPIVSLGINWLGKWISSNKGYSLMISDGVHVWGEQRNVDYIKEKSQEWATCLIADVEELSELILSELSKEDSILRLSYESTYKITIDLEGVLDPLPYSWLFYLSLVDKNVIEHHWTLPIATTLEFMSARIFKLEEELKRKSRQLEEVQNKKIIETDTTTNLINSSVQKVFTLGLGKVLSSQLSYSAILLSKMEERKKLNQSIGIGKVSNEPHNRPKLKKPLKGTFAEELPLKQEAVEATRRAEIQSMQSSPKINPVKKKKRLNI